METNFRTIQIKSHHRYHLHLLPMFESKLSDLDGSDKVALPLWLDLVEAGHDLTHLGGQRGEDLEGGSGHQAHRVLRVSTRL